MPPNQNLLGWVGTGLLALLAFLGTSLWTDQRQIAQALTENTLALRELTIEFKGYIAWDADRATRLEKIQGDLTERMNRAGIKP